MVEDELQTLNSSTEPSEDRFFAMTSTHIILFSNLKELNSRAQTLSEFHSFYFSKLNFSAEKNYKNLHKS